ncbi:MAG: hypothetical protein HZB25_06160 [Candidatus Eisenbacteria bacterium]|nr:hypothetical protein [Candidatus Eisenbacteria bacterium]
MSSKSLAAAPAVAALLCLTVIPARAGALQSVWAGQPVPFDSSGASWSPRLADTDVQGVRLAAWNDSHFLYLCFEFHGAPASRAVMRSGLTVWLDARGKEKKEFGVHYPMGLATMGLMLVGGPEGGGRDRMRGRAPQEGDEAGNPPDAPPGEAPAPPDSVAREAERAARRTQLARLQQEMLHEAEIIGPAKDNRRRVLTSELTDLTVTVACRDSVVLYRLCVPFSTSAAGPYALRLEERDQEIAVGFECSRPQRSMRGGGEGVEGRGRGMRGGGGGGGWDAGRGRGPRGEGRGGPRGGPGGEGRFGGERMDAEFDAWVRVKLAEAEPAAK